MSRGYLSIDSILVEEERVPVQFFIHAPRLGHLDATTGAEVCVCLTLATLGMSYLQATSALGMSCLMKAQSACIDAFIISVPSLVRPV